MYFAAVTAATCVQAAFQLDELASMDKTNINGSHRRGDLIPYDKSAIKILKEKRKTKAFCRFEKRNNHRQLPITDIETVIEEDATSEASSDIFSVTSLQSISGDCSVTMINGYVLQSTICPFFYEIPVCFLVFICTGNRRLFGSNTYSGFQMGL